MILKNNNEILSEKYSTACYLLGNALAIIDQLKKEVKANGALLIKTKKSIKALYKNVDTLIYKEGIFNVNEKASVLDERTQTESRDVF